MEVTGYELVAQTIMPIDLLKTITSSVEMQPDKKVPYEILMSED